MMTYCFARAEAEWNACLEEFPWWDQSDESWEPWWDESPSRSGSPGGEWLTLHEVAKQQCVSYLTVWRWSTVGYSGMLLQAEKVGNRWQVTQKAIDEFKGACLALARGTPVKPTQKQRQHKIHEARSLLEKEGF